MNTVSDAGMTFSITGQTITSIPAETPGGASLGNVNVLPATTPQAPRVSGDPAMAPLWECGREVDPNRYRILTLEYGLPNRARSLVEGSVTRIIWRVAGFPDSVSDDIIVDSRAGGN